MFQLSPYLNVVSQRFVVGCCEIWEAEGSKSIPEIHSSSKYIGLVIILLEMIFLKSDFRLLQNKLLHLISFKDSLSSALSQA